MTTNTYQSLCDDVGAYNDDKCGWARSWDNCYLWTLQENGCKFCENNKRGGYPPKSAEQILSLEELILKLGRLSYHKSDIYYICILSRVNNANNGMAGTRPQALYALTHKLVAEKVLSKEEVKDCLIAK